MIRTLLIRGMLAGFLAGIAAFGFARLYGEPQVDRAIAFEAAAEHAAHHTHQASDGTAEEADAEPELVSRTTQAGLGLLTGVTVYGTAFGGLFSLVFAAMLGRLPLGPRGLSALLAGSGFVAICLIPGLVYPPNPPAIGQADTITQRTALHFEMLLISLSAMTLAFVIRQRFAARWGGWNSTLAGIVFALLALLLIGHAMPVINEIPVTFPADLLWHFRVASFGTQAVLWGVIGISFGWFAERQIQHSSRPTNH
ncbi:putative membrane spanning protein [Granulibacter bethesdensis]|uniref:Membrane spanning protein n=1 Tax=Granulibacter bethesdensis TaxID=364410 RepID=A0AAC9KC17_9PROT|nr:CbtA family protein [Granulibacter bethesdensis]APH55707.1 putative membrane spanning protein [Granulibacter bethesdensis]APH63292.1 putative membrane spanning protein [Granulibacter bethesdensis]